MIRMSASNQVHVLGVGITPFRRPKSYNWDYPDMVKQAGSAALMDAGVDYSQVQAVVCSYCYGEPTSGQRAVYELGLTGVPVFNVNNNCSSASSAIQLARYLLQSGNFECVMAVGFEKMDSGLTKKFDDRADPAERHFTRLEQLANQGQPLKPLKGMNRMTSEVIRMFALAAHEYQLKHPATSAGQVFGAIANKNRQHGLKNENACLYERPLPSVEQACTERMISAPITVHQSALTADGSACAVLCSSSFLTKSTKKQKERAVTILAQNMVTDLPSSFETNFAAVCGFDMSKRAADLCFRESGVRSSDIQVAEVHDCFAPNELFMYEALQFTAPGNGPEFFRSGQWVENGNGGRVYRCGNVVVNPSGGLESKGHPIGATGLAQCHELVTQLRHEAKHRQVPGCQVALQHNFGIGGAAVVTLYSRNQNTTGKSKL